MDARHVIRISRARLNEIQSYLTSPQNDIELTSFPFKPMPLSMQLITSFESDTSHIMGYVWEHVPRSMLFRIEMYISDTVVIMECRCLYDKEDLFTRWMNWLKD
jgi:hypothetical protein